MSNVNKPSIPSNASIPVHTNAASSAKVSSTASATPAASGVTSRSSLQSPAFKGFQVPSILTWKNPFETGVLLAETLGLFLVFGSTFTLRYFLRFASSVVGLLSVVEWASRSVSGQRKGLVSTYQPSRFLPLSENVVNDVASYVAYAFRRLTFGIQHLLDARDPAKGLRLAGLLYGSYILLWIFSLKALLLSGIIVAFSVPPLYLQFKPEVDKAISQILAHLHEHAKNASTQIHAKAGPQIEFVKKLVGPRGGFDTTKNVSPIGEVPTAAAKPTQYTSQKPSSLNTSPLATSGLSSSHSTESPSNAPTPGVAHTNPANVVKPVNVNTNPTSANQIPDDLFKSFDTVPTLAGNVPIDHQKLSAALAADKAKAEGAVNGL